MMKPCTKNKIDKENEEQDNDRVNEEKKRRIFDLSTIKPCDSKTKIKCHVLSMLTLSQDYD